MKDFTDITFIVDRSGSMMALVNDVVGGYESFVKEQQKLGDNAALTLVQFDDQYETVFANVPLANVSPKLKFSPRGMTALLDAVGRTINSIGARLSALPESERPDKVMVVIFTDGYENASKEFSYEQLSEMVKRQTNVYKWHFLFLGANIDSFGVAGKLGINVNTVTNYDYSSKGMRSAVMAVGSYTSSLRQHGVVKDTLDAMYQSAEADAENANKTSQPNGTAKQ